jgi:Zn-dependent M16 (insulinase) family peptidase
MRPDRVALLGAVAVTAVLMAGAVRADEAFDKLQPNQRLADFAVETVYDNGIGATMGARFRHVPSGFVMDVLRIQTVPQAFMWVNSPPPSDQGEPHTCEHLLLGKGTRGRFVASLEDMSLGNSSAFTMQMETCYHYHTAAGVDVFYQLMEKKLEAMLFPTFSDEEIRREVCHMGLKFNSEDSSYSLEEKGTVYNEMMSTYERPWSPIFRELGHLQYGKGHPMSLDAGGYPDAIRTMTPAHMRKFIAETHHLNNMSMIVAIPDEITIEDCLGRTSAIFAKLEPNSTPGADPATSRDRVPPPQPSPAGSISLVSFPHQNAGEPGVLVFGWQPTRNLSNNDMYLLELLWANLAGDETSVLYQKFIDSQKRAMDIGASSVFAWTSLDPGQPLYLGFDNVRRDALDDTVVAKVRDIVMGEIARVAAFADGSPELTVFNEQAKARIIERRREMSRFLNSPPQFGFRGTGSRWMEHLKRLQRESGFRKSLALNSEMGTAERALSSTQNPWRSLVANAQLSTPLPYAVAAVADPGLLEKSEDDRQSRVVAYIGGLRQKYGVTNDKDAINKFREEYDAQTAVIEAEAATIPMPGFINNPPMTLDDQLRFGVNKLAGGGALVNSTFDNMTGATVGLAFNMNVVPEDLLPYTAALPTLLSDVGIVRDGQPIAYDQVRDQIRRDILELSAYYSSNPRTERVELVVRAAGSDVNESGLAIGWMSDILFSPDWRVENLPRIRDAVDLALANTRNTMRNSEESWVDDPANAYWRQTNPLYLHTSSFLTETHALHRLRWRLKDSGPDAAFRLFSDFMTNLADYGNTASREDLISLTGLLSPEGIGEGALSPRGQNIAFALTKLPEPARTLAYDAVKDLRLSMSDVPDATLGADWEYLCRQIVADLSVPPSRALDDLKKVMGLVLAADNVRAFMVGSESNQKALAVRLEDITRRVSPTPSKRQSYSALARIAQRLQERTPGMERPVYVGLINENTRAGVHISTAPCASYTDHDHDELLDFLAARLYGGGGAHSMFMKTWGAGLAYSNGLRSNESTGRILYYAERCPDLAQTMQFVVNELKNAPYDTSLAEYAVAQAFGAYRSGSRYEVRGEAIAGDLADGVTPDAVRSFRRGILALRDSRDLYGELHARMPFVYGGVLPGYGPAESEVQGAIPFVIGPEKQFESYEKYLKSVEGAQTKLYRLYPRDYWIVAPVAH